MRIIYTGSFRFPNKDAASQRVLTIGKILRELGHVVIFWGWEQSNGAKIDYNYDGFKCFSQNELDNVSNNIFKKFINFIFRGSNTITNLKKYVKNQKLDVIVAYNANSIFLYKLYKFCKRNNVKLICDCTEWYEPEHLPGGKYGLSNLDNNIRITKIYPLIKNIFVISTFLKDFLDKAGCNTLVIPPLVDLQDKKWSTLNNNFEKGRIYLIYAGDPGKKDLFAQVFEALTIINKDGIKIEMTMIGSTEAEVRKINFDGREIPKFLKIIGRIPMDQVPEFYKKAHFSILFRENKRYAHAGFPTKLVESLTSGVPLITNNTSDIARYILYGVTGFVLENYSVDTIVQCFKEILKISKEEMEKFRDASTKASRENFDFHVYEEVMDQYLKNIEFCL